ncbi:AEC family transporter [Vallitaleaceae bacterium 9-2]
MDIQNVLLKLAQLFILLFAGYILVGVKGIKQEAAKHISNLIFSFTLPAMLISSMVNTVEITREDVLRVMLIAIVQYGFLIIAAIVLTKLLRVPYEDVGLYRFMILFGNVAFVGYPVLSAVLGNDALFFAAILNLPFNILVFTLGITFITHGTDQHQKLELKVFLNPGLIATVIGLILFFASIQLPTFVNELLADVGDMTTPLSLLVIGASLYGVDIRSIFKKRMIFIFSFIKLIVIPTLLAIILWLAGVDTMIASVVIILSGMPMAANAVILCQEYDTHVMESSEAVFVSTLLLGVSLPYMIFLIRFLF